MKKKPTFSRHINQDVVVCRTTNVVISNRVSRILLERSVPFSKGWKRIPLIKRHLYKGAHKMYVISTNRTQYGNARRALFDMDETDYARLLINMI